MSERRTLIVTGIVVVLIIALIIGIIWYLFNFIRARQNQTPVTSDIFPKTTSSTIVVSPDPNSSPEGSSVPFSTSNTVVTQTPAPTSRPTATPIPAATAAPIISPSNPSVKIYTGSGFTVTYPKTWGILTCNNSKNFELDPNNSNDQLNVACSFAVKPITVIVGQTTCAGDTLTLGSTKVIKSVKTGTKGPIYRWCTQTNPMLDITHRIAPASQTGYSKDDFSPQIENIISNMTFSSGV